MKFAARCPGARATGGARGGGEGEGEWAARADVGVAAEVCSGCAIVVSAVGGSSEFDIVML